MQQEHSMKLIPFLFALLLASSASADVLVPFTCPTLFSAQHWGYDTGTVSGDVEQFATAGSWDCEWNGLCDASPDDPDCLDPTDPRADWFYDFVPDGYLVSNAAWSLTQNHSVETLTTGKLDFAVLGGAQYYVSAERTVDGPVLSHHSVYDIVCPSGLFIRWMDTSGAPLPAWTAATAETCRLDYVAACKHSHIPLPGDQSAVVCDDEFRVVRKTSQGCGIGPELLFLALLFRKLRS
jgi:hypothetical protein